LEAAGVETFYAVGAAESMKLAQVVQKNLVNILNANNRDAKEGSFWVLINNIPTAILVETGFITNAAEEDKLRQELYRQKIAESIYQGIDSYLKSLI
jgi:N-acetylmuramoyl-L-alanine amidase